MKKSDLIYSAGFFDGEGYVSMRRRKAYRRNCNYINIGCGVCQSDEHVINWFKSVFGGSVTHRKRNKNYREMWDWDLSCNKAKEFLKLVLPYLKVKKKQVEIVINFQENRKQTRGRKTRYDIDFEEAALNRLIEARNG